MALTVTVTKGSVTKGSMDGLFHASIKVLVVDDTPSPGFTKTFTHTFKQSDDNPDLLAKSMARMEPKLEADLKAAIADYLATRVYFARKQFGDIAASLQTTVQTGLEV